MEPTRDLIDALERLFVVAMRDTGQAGRVASFLLSWANQPVYGGFDFSWIRSLDDEIVFDIRTVMDFLFDSGFRYPIDIGFESKILALAQQKRPDVVERINKKSVQISTC